MKTSTKLLLIYFILILILLFGSPFLIYAQTPTPMPGKGAPKVTPPGFPTISTLRLHMNEGIGNFIQFDRVWNDKGDVVKYYFNQSKVKNDINKGHITVWLLIEYTPQGRDLILSAYRAQGINVNFLNNWKYTYYPLTFAYGDDFNVKYEDEFEYDVAVLTGGELLDSDKNILALEIGDATPSKKFQKLNTDNMTYVKLAGELRKRYNLK